jgi:hypothetical protein
MNISLRRGMVLGSLFARRSRTATRFLATMVGAALALALSGLFGLVNFVGNIRYQSSAQQLGEQITDGCVEGKGRSDYYRLNQYVNIQIAARCEKPPTPPGLETFPKPGQIFLSPALDHLRRTDSNIALRFPRVDGQIAPSGLTSSNELRSITGIESTRNPQSMRSTFNVFGNHKIDYLASALRFDERSLFATGLLFALPPSLYLIAACTRLNARTRERQLGLLSVLGLDAKSIKRTLTIEAALTTGAGSLIGVAIAAVLYRRLTPTFVAWKAFQGDFAPTWKNLATVVVLIVSAAVVAASFAARPINRRTERNRKRADNTRQRPRPQRAKAWSHAWRWLLLGVSVVASFVTTWWEADNAMYLALGGRALTFVALVMFTPIVCQTVGRHLVDSNHALTALVGARLRSPSGTLTRALAAVAAGLFLFSTGATIVDTLGRDPASIKQQYEQDGYNVLEINRTNDKNRLLLGNFDVLVADERSLPGTPPGLLTGTCTAFAKVVGVQPKCDHSAFYVHYDQTIPSPEMGDLPRIVLKTPRSPVVEGRIITLSDTAPVIPPLLGEIDSKVVYLSLPVTEAQQLYSRLIGNDPNVNVQITGAGSVGGASEMQSILDVFRWGAAFAITIALLATLVSLTALLYDRQPGNNYLQILGISPTQTAKIVLLEIAAAATAALSLAVFMSWLWAISYSKSANQEPVGIFALVSPFIGSLVVLLTFGAVMILVSTRNSNSNLINERDRLASADDIFVTVT